MSISVNPGGVCTSDSAVPRGDGEHTGRTGQKVWVTSYSYQDLLCFKKLSRRSLHERLRDPQVPGLMIKYERQVVTSMIAHAFSAFPLRNQYSVPMNTNSVFSSSISVNKFSFKTGANSRISCIWPKGGLCGFSGKAASSIHK